MILNNGGVIMITYNSFDGTNDKYVPREFISVLTNKLNSIQSVLTVINNIDASCNITDKHESLSVTANGLKECLQDLINYIKNGYMIAQNESYCILNQVRSILIKFRECAYVYDEIHYAPTYILEELREYYTDIATIRDTLENR